MLRRRLSPVLFLSLAGALVGCDQSNPLGVPSPLSSTALLAKKGARPFRATLEGNANPDFSQGPCNVSNTESGTGHALHLGKVTWSSTEVVNFCVDPEDPTLAAVSGQMVIIAANGDHLTLSYSTTVRADFSAGTLTASGTFTITGGTGRFADATGGGTLTATGSLVPPFEIAGTLAGEVSY
jgi:hypothetical protein